MSQRPKRLRFVKVHIGTHDQRALSGFLSEVPRPIQNVVMLPYSSCVVIFRDDANDGPWGDWARRVSDRALANEKHGIGKRLAIKRVI